MRSIIEYLRCLVHLLKKQWLIEIRYPKIYPEAQIKSILPKALLENSYGLFVESNVTIKNQDLKIGKHTYIGNNTFIDSCSSIGAFCSISSDVKIGMRNHPLNYISTSPVFYSKYRKWVKESTFDERNIKTVTIKDDVLISANAIVLNGIKIGRGAVIGAGSIVTHDVPPYAIVAGVPAKIIRYRFSNDQIDLIEQSKWWLKDDKTLKNAIKYSNNPELFISHL